MYKSFAYFQETYLKLANLAKFYSEDAIDVFLHLPSDEREEFASNFIVEINRVAESIYLSLNRSIISGDYIFIESLEKKLDRIKSDINSIISNVPNAPGAGGEIINKLFDDLQSSFSIPVLHSIAQFKLLISQVNFKLSSTKAIHLFDIINDKDNNGLVNNPLGTMTSDLHQVFLLNIQLAKIDHNIAVRKDYLELLINIQKQLEGALSEVPQTIALLINILIDKCNYLLYKVLFRLKKDKRDFLYRYEYEDKELNIEEIKKTIHFYSPFLEFTENHYNIGDRFGPFYDKIFSFINEKVRKGQDLLIGDYHTLVNYYKDQNRSVEQVNNIVEQFDEVYKAKSPSLKTQFDRRAFNTSYNYLLNNRISLAIYKNKYSEEVAKVLEKRLEFVSIVQQETHINNYFPFYRFSFFLLRSIKSELEQEQPNQHLIKRLIKKAEDNLTRALGNYEWCKERDYLPFQLPKKECTIYNRATIDEKPLPVFLASSFVLPVNYDELGRELSLMQTELHKLKSQSEIQIKIDSEKAKIQAIRNEIGQHDRKQIEILSIFSGIVLFTMGSIKIYENVQNFNQAILFMVAFAFSLGLFVICIWVVTRYGTIKLTPMHWAIFGSYILFTCLLIYIVKRPMDYNYPRKMAPLPVGEPDFNVDSLSKTKTFIR
ncbi:hypothetical protein TH63_00335 [Rufibacter radiotolerans]|uniref:Uncharacterized protein n=1 Tax=Rufibacter radiotolerans TaxID=1379910 RepID=A0A0H4VKM0_9BACT|nr:hypothetical protein [Rufibacter radiotolerans]AKQ44432.1 hypothetical protein TH63_00335 [Rufibacter radiotolerans]